MATHPGMGNLSERTPYKTWVLKVSIHCEGCKKKVRKVIQSIEGVYTVDIDIKQHRVVVTGNVEGHTLVRKLIKSGKNAELWPQIAPPPQAQERKPRNLKKKEVKLEPEPLTPQEARHGGSEREKPDKKVEAEDVPVKTSSGAPEKGESSNSAANNNREGGETVARADGGGGGGGGAAESKHPPKNRAGGGESTKLSDGGAEISGSGGPAVEPTHEGKKPEMGSAVEGLPAKSTAEESGGKAGEGGATGESTQPSESGSIGKKKKKKGQSSSALAGPSNSAVPASRGLLPQDMNTPPGANLDRPRHHGYDYPPHYYAPPPPVATVSYSTAYPTASHTTSYYATPPPYSNAYAYPRPENEAPPHDYQPYPQQPLDSFELFSDENPNGCLIM